MKGTGAVYFTFMGDLVISIDWFKVDNQGISIGYVLGGRSIGLA